MTSEESKAIWELEKKNTDPKTFTKEFAKLYALVDELINNDIITYEDFTNDTIDAVTTNIIDNTKEDKDPDRHEQIKAMCLTLLDKYNNLKDKKNG